MPDVDIIKQDIETAEVWDDAYWIGSFMYEQALGEADKLSMDAYEKAFALGLNIRVNRECFLTASQRIARIYFQFRKYDEAINKLMILDANEDNLPDWVNLYYASAQIHTENILYWAEVPKLLFKRIDGINESDLESVSRRRFLYLEFLNRISELARTKDVSGVDKEAILAKAEDLGIADSRECLNFKAALGIIPAVPDWPDESEIELETKDGSVYEQMAVELNKRLIELQAIVDKQALTIEQNKRVTEDQLKQIDVLQSEKSSLENNVAHQKEKLKIAKEHEYTIEARCQALERQLSGSETTRKQLEENAALIGELRTDVEDLKNALTVSQRHIKRLQTEINQHQSTISELENSLLQHQEENRKLHTVIESQRTQIEAAEAAIKEAEERASRSTKDEVSREDRELTDKPTATAVQSSLLDILKVNNYLQRNKKILIIGGSETKESHLRGKLKSMGFVFEKDQLEFVLDYDDVKSYSSRIIQWDSKYAGIIVGPCPHKAKDTKGYSSFIEQMKTEEGYPHIEEARDKSGALKISNASIFDAMMKMAVYLQSIA